MNELYFEDNSNEEGLSYRLLEWENDLVNMWTINGLNQRVPFKGVGTRWHAHEDIEITLVTDGKGVIAAGDYINSFEAPSLFFFGENLPHVWSEAKKTSGLSIQINKTILGQLLTLPELEQVEANFDKAKFGVNIIGETFKKIESIFLSLKKQSSLQKVSSLFLLFDALAKANPSELEILSKTKILAAQTKEHGQVQNVINFIFSNYKTPITLSNMVEKSSMSQATFIRHFFKATGKTVINYVNSLRLQEVRRLLLETDGAVVDLAYAVGFNNLSHFNTLFKREFNCTPSEFRKNLSRRRMDKNSP